MKKVFIWGCMLDIIVESRIPYKGIAFKNNSQEMLNTFLSNILSMNG